MSPRTAFDIFHHPYDLTISILKAKEENKLGYIICRGPEDNHRLLIESDPIKGTVSCVVSCIRTTVENAMTFALGGKAGDPENDSVLNQPLIDRMMDVLLKNSHVNTSTMLQPTAN